MVNFSWRWNGDGFFSQAMEWWWFWKFLTITIDGFWWDQPLATMVFQWFFSNFGDQWFTMANKLKFATSCMAIEMLKTKIQAKDLFHKKTRKLVNKKQKNLILTCKKYFNQYFMYMLSPYLIFKQKDDIKAIHKGRKITTIAPNQWFLRWPLPLVEW